ncbi:unnamed protein product [Caenorhabditis angaria]|uniref:Uncharacterized protein n=1 Tax=Caenorhabditis angaria TaxID=860376 RepID=A0A9P1NB03_9PELO|nr:unnamed protein product [Caenorhabditis angaria]
MFHLPCDGPFGCFDYYSYQIIAIDEARNNVIQSDIDGTNIIRFRLPSQLNNEHFCWIKIYYVNGRFILGLLKSHVDKSFHLITVRLNHEDESCTIIRQVQTGISSHGLRVEAHRSMSQFVFSICNTKMMAKRKIQRNCDRQSFMKQLKGEQNTRKSDEDEKSSDSSSAGITPEDMPKKKHTNIMESVLLLVKTESNGEIIPTILSTGRRRYGIKMHRTRSIRQLNRTFSTKFMTRWQTLSPIDEACEPFLWGNNACVIPKNDTSVFYVAHTILNPKSGLIASLMYKLSHRFRTHTPVTEPVQNKIRGQGPPSKQIWSNIDIIQGCPTFLTMNPKTMRIKRWQILRDNFGKYDWKTDEIDIAAPEDTDRIMFRCNAENVTPLEFTIRFQRKKSDGQSTFHNISVPRIVVENDC